MINYKEIWESINQEAEDCKGEPKIARQIFPSNTFSVFLATDFKQSVRHLYVLIDDNNDIFIDDLPRFMGLDISLCHASVGEFKNQKFLRLTQPIPNTENIFELVISDICDRIIVLKTKQELITALKICLEEWKFFFEKRENHILPISLQKGLCGELFFLKEYLFPRYGFRDSLYYWTGSDRTNRDFQIGSMAIEIKATSGKQHKKVIISSEKQLDDNGLDCLLLGIVQLNTHENMPDKNLPTLITEIREMLESDVIAYFHFEIKIAKYGYSAKLANKYTTGFSLEKISFFKVSEGFPRLLLHDLCNGIGDIKYSIALSACSQFEIDKSLVEEYLK